MAQALADPTDFGNEPGDGPLRVGGVATAEPSESDRPDTRSKASAAQMGAAMMCRDLYRGTEIVRSRGQMYLPRAPGEDFANYKSRLERSVFNNMFGRSVDGLTGLIFRADPVFSNDTPPQILAHWENIDMAGTHGDVFLRDIVADAMDVGHAAILVEFPQTDGTQSRADESAGIRPYWVPIKKEDIMSWRTVNRGGATVLTQIVLREITMEPAGSFGEQEVTRYRQLFMDDGIPKWQLLEVKKDRSVATVGTGEYPTLNQIPIIEIATSGRRGLFESDPPLLDVAYLNVAHYQTWSDYVYAIHKTNVPIFVTTGMVMEDESGNPIEMILGPNTGVNIPDPAGTARYVSHNGASLHATKAALDDLKSDIGTLGLAMLAPQKRMAETAEAKRLDKATSDSGLAVAARALQDAVDRALAIHAEYMRLPTGGSIAINRDFEGNAMESGVMRAYAELGRSIGLPIDVIIRELQAGGRISDDVDIEELELRMMAGMAAAQAFGGDDEEEVGDDDA